MERKYRKQIYLQAVTDFHPEQFEVTAEKKDRAERPQGSERHPERSGGDHERNRHRDRNRSDSHRNDHHRQENPPKLPAPLPVPLATPVIRPLETPIAPAAGVAVQTQGAPTAPVQGAEGDDDSQVALLGNTTGSATGTVAGSTSSSEDSIYDEEDRLAFLRAQAAQDAALARLGSGSNTHRPNSDPNRDRGGGGGGGRRNARGSRRSGGKFRPRNERGRDRDRGAKPGVGQQGRWTEAQREGAPVSTPSPANSSSAPAPSSGGSQGGSGGGGGGGGNKNGAGSGGEHSQPPI
ncbi:MAG: hypothetical protein HYX41_06750 [Bdellovibrio sp.]|nr:hypothetical protein [Bdellovibrio sp.]